MKEHLKCYRVVLKTMAPVFIGSGREIGKKEYFFLNQEKVGIPDIQGLYGWMCRLGKEKAFEDYLLGKQNIDLIRWLKFQEVKINELKPFIKYTLDYSDAVLGADRKRLQVMECIKDAYGNPYIPGSSLKGMFRTIILGADIINMAHKYQNAGQDLIRNLNNRNLNIKNLDKDIKNIEGIKYRTLHRERTQPLDAVNDVLQGFLVSDSEPLTVDSLVLCQKVDIHIKGSEKRFPLLRECIKPNTEICFTITVDMQICPYTEENILGFIKVFMDSYYDNFLSSFTGTKRPGEKDIFLGGGCGFVSKTVVYPLYGKKEGVETVSKIFEKKRVPREHKHYLDKEYGVSPHTLKCTKYKGKIYQMGLCRVEKMELV